MKNIFFTLLLFLCLSGIKAQMTNLIFFTEQGERFSVVLNGILQNGQPQTNIKVTDLPAPNYKLKIIFEDKNLGQIDKNLLFSQGTESTFAIKRNSKGEYVVRFLNSVPIAEAPQPVQEQSVIVYRTEPATAVTTTTTTTTTNAGTPGIGININDPYSGGNVSMNLNLGMGTGVQQSTTTTTTTTTGSSNTEHYNSYPDGYNDRNDPNLRGNGYDQRGNDHPQHQNHDQYELPGYNGPYGCHWPMSPADFADAKSSINSKSFEDSKLTIAKQIIQSNCLLSSQVKEIMLLFSFEDTRLTFAKFAYAYTLDLRNYYKLNDAFTFESSIDELNQFIEGSGR